MRDKRLYRRGRKIWCRVPDATGRIVRRATGCTDEEAASARANEYERAATDPRYAAASQTTLAHAVDAYLTDLVRRRRSEATKKIAAQKCGHFIRIWGGDLPMARVTAQLVLEYIDKRQHEDVVDFTIKKELGHLRQILTIAQFRGTFTGRLEETIPPYFSGKHTPRSRAPSPAEAHAIIANLEPRRGAHVAYILATGARRSESFRALRSDTDWETRTVQMHGTKTDASKDKIPITPLTERLLAWALERAPGKRVLFHPWQNLSRDLEAACDRAGVAKVTPNDLRRAFATWHQAAGVDNDTVARMMRHTTAKLVESTYGRASAADFSRLLNEQLRGVPALYQATAETTPNAEQQPMKQPENAAPPARIELATNGLGNRPKSPRSAGNKAAWQRRKHGAGVPELYALRDALSAQDAVWDALDGFSAAEEP